MLKNSIIIGGIVILGILGFLFLSQREINKENSSTSLIPINEITHGHGLSVDVLDSSKVYIATHHGLLLLENEKELYQVGESKDDYMGFSPHPTNSKIFFSSGHPSSGGNIGFQKTEDSGFTWKKVSDGIQGPVDFHAMTVSPANPNLLYGWFRGAIQRSMDGGESWQKFPNNFVVVNLAADPKDENIVYAASPQGLMVSKNKGTSFDRLFDGFVSVVAINPLDPQKLLSFSEKNKLASSSDAGKAWKKLNETFNGETPLFISFNKQNPGIVYTLTEKNSIYKSSDGGNSWSKIR